MYPAKLFAKPLTRSEQEELINAFKKRLLGFSGLKQLYLVGSASRFAMTDASDLDFVAVFLSEDGKESAKKEFYCSPRPIDWPCDVLWYTEDEFQQRKKIGGICQIAAEDGIKLVS
jgi:hypothetical protein